MLQNTSVLKMYVFILNTLFLFYVCNKTLEYKKRVLRNISNKKIKIKY